MNWVKNKKANPV